MKKIFLIITIALLIVSCNKKKEKGEVSSWRLVEQLFDPGDGSGEFEPVDSDKTITFFEDGIIKSNGELCSMEAGITEEGSTGNYISESNTITANCSGNDFSYSYEMNGDELIVSFPCIEPCRHKFKKQ